jgi:hypothetical protein
MAIVTVDIARANRAAPWQSDVIWPLRYWVATLWKVAVLAVFAAWLLFVGQTHEPWFDEAQAWLIARDSSFFDLIAHRVRYEGTPALWHVTLWCAIRAGLPFSKLYLISTSCAVIGAAVILWRSPFPVVLRITVIASYFIAYQFSVVARSYSLDLVLMPLLAHYFTRRTERPILYAIVLGLIANANTHGFLAAACFGAEWSLAILAADRLTQPRVLTGLGLACVLGLLALVTAWQPPDNIFLQTFPPPRQGLTVVIYYIREAFLDRINFQGTSGASEAGTVIAFFISVMLLVPSLILFRRAGNGLLAMSLFGTLTAFSVWKYAYAWHAGLLYLVWLVCAWISWPATRDNIRLRRWVIASMFTVTVPQAVEAMQSGVGEVHHAFSAGPQVAVDVARWRHLNPDGRIAALGFNVFAVQPWFPANIFVNYHHGNARPSYVRWSRDETWKGTVTGADWRQALESKPDMILASSSGTPASWQIALAQACRDGFATVRIYPASPIWKGYFTADNSMAMLVRRKPGLSCTATLRTFAVR